MGSWAFAKVTPPYPFRDRGAGTDDELVARRARELREAIVKEGPDTVSAVITEPVISSGGLGGARQPLWLGSSGGRRSWARRRSR